MVCCLAQYRELRAHDDVDPPDSSVQVLGNQWIFDLEIDTTTRMKARIVADGQTQILYFDCFDIHAPTVPMCETLNYLRPSLLA